MFILLHFFIFKHYAISKFIKIFLMTSLLPLIFLLAPPPLLPKSRPLSEYYSAEKIMKTDGESESGMDPEVDALLLRFCLLQAMFFMILNGDLMPLSQDVRLFQSMLKSSH